MLRLWAGRGRAGYERRCRSRGRVEAEALDRPPQQVGSLEVDTGYFGLFDVREIGTRAALGAPPRRLLTSVLTRATRQLALGVGIGLLAAAGLARRGRRVQPTEALRTE